MEFEWDAAKAAANVAKHGIDFEDASRIFRGPVLRERSDREGEERWTAIGMSLGVEITVAYTVRNGRLRLISARRARRHERRRYRQAFPI